MGTTHVKLTCTYNNGDWATDIEALTPKTDWIIEVPVTNESPFKENWPTINPLIASFSTIDLNFVIRRPGQPNYILGLHLNATAEEAIHYFFEDYGVPGLPYQGWGPDGWYDSDGLRYYLAMPQGWIFDRKMTGEPPHNPDFWEVDLPNQALIVRYWQANRLTLKKCDGSDTWYNFPTLHNFTHFKVNAGQWEMRRDNPGIGNPQMPNPPHPPNDP